MFHGTQQVGVGLRSQGGGIPGRSTDGKSDSWASVLGTSYPVGIT